MCVMAHSPEPRPHSWEARLAAARSGDRGVWRSLFDELSPAVRGYLRLQGAADPDDLASETFLAVFRGIEGFEGTSTQFRSWVFVIAHRRLIDERRRRSRAPLTELDPNAELSTRDEVVADDALGRLAIERIVALCERLAPDQRDVLLLRIVGDLTIEQIADTVGKSIGAVKALQRRGLVALEKFLTNEGVPL